MQLPIRDQLQCMHLHLKIHEYIELFTWLSAMERLLGISILATQAITGRRLF